VEGKLEGFEPVKAGWDLDEFDGFDLDAGLGCEHLGFLVCLAGRGLDLEWGLGLLVKVQVACLGEELFPLHLHDLVDICGVECFSLAIGVKRLRAVDGAVEQEVCIERLQELQDVLPILGRPLVRCAAKAPLGAFAAVDSMMVMRPDSSLPLLLRAWAQWLIT
jgi:hypothetical protein